MIYAAWAVEFALELSGAVLAFRRKLWYLFALLVFRAFADVLSFAFLFVPVSSRYFYPSWVSFALQYAILCALAVKIAAVWIRENRDLMPYALATGLLAAAIIGWRFWTAPTFRTGTLHAVIAASFVFGGVLGAGWIGRVKGLPAEWQGIMAGLALSVGGNALVAVLALRWHQAALWAPGPAIMALAVWNLAARPFKPRPLLIRPLPPEVWEHVAAIRNEMERATGVYLPPQKEERGNRSAIAAELMKQKWLN